MSVLLLGISHRSAPVPVLEKIAVSDADRPKLIDLLLSSSHVSEALIVSTCNRVEIYAVVDAFHPALSDLSGLLSEHSGLNLHELTKHAYVRYSEAAVEHLFAVASGLDSMVVGEQQILGQLRSAYAAADERQAVGRVLHELAQQALRVGKRVHSETRIDSAGASVVSVALEHAKAVLAVAGRERSDLAGCTATVVGAGAMGGLTVAHLTRAGIGQLIIVNRTKDRGERLAATATANGVVASAVDLSQLTTSIARSDILVTCTGAVGAVVRLADVHRAMASRDERRQPLIVCDLGLPRDVEHAVAGLPGVTVIDMETLQHDPAAGAAKDDAEAARDIVSNELASYLYGQRLAEVTPTVTALRQRAAEVVESELMRLESRLPDLGDPQRDEVANTVRRVVEKLLHAPTVRVKQLAATPGGDTYAEALRELFELKPGAAQAVTAPTEILRGDDDLESDPLDGTGAAS